MKKLLILSLLFSSLAFGVEPKFAMQDVVIYPVEHFYSKVCSGVGNIRDYWTTPSGETKYLVRDNRLDCPNMDWHSESKLKLKETK